MTPAWPMLQPFSYHNSQYHLWLCDDINFLGRNALWIQNDIIAIVLGFHISCLYVCIHVYHHLYLQSQSWLSDCINTPRSRGDNEKKSGDMKRLPLKTERNTHNRDPLFIQSVPLGRILFWSFSLSICTKWIWNSTVYASRKNPRLVVNSPIFIISTSKFSREIYRDWGHYLSPRSKHSY